MSRHIHPAKLRALRIERGLTQEDLAEAAQVSVRTLQRIESGAPAFPHTRARILAALEVPIAQLRGDDGPTDRPPSTVGGRVTLVASTKGGTGRTMLAISLAGLLAHARRSVCVVDFDPYRGTSRHIALAMILRQSVPTHILAQGGPVDVARRLAGLQQGFDHVIIDSSAYEGAELLPVALLADQILLTTDHPRLDLGITHRVRMWQDVAAHVRGALSIVRTKASRYASHRRRDAAFLAQLGLPVCETVLHARAAYTYAFARGQTVTADDPQGHAAAEVRQLAHELGCVPERPAPAVRDRPRTADDRRYLEASMRRCHPSAVVQIPWSVGPRARRR